ncbi:TIGR03545 family protein [Bdellovibrio bacteriovorus]|uniref:TIGR03545 family protein n=1 Tax=Bdellovibrio bacteriovorus TaxID=959 RepID=A0A150WFS3_BDEBC|nr:TIGR03545 family protein [Bdellovibrio bacteriovorus]KYG61948.1 TIGR03545 family protein [Bdellovibrio bacteriovorus]
MANTTQDTAKPLKKKGIIRWEAIIPFAIICAIIALYFHFFFDTHLRRALEWAGYNAVGAEVNIAKLETSFFNASLRIQGIEVTDAERPTHDSIKIGDIRFSMLWDALLRAKVVVNEAAVEQIEFGVLRKKPGKVKPPEPDDGQPSMTEKLKAQALKEAQEEYGDNVLGDVIAMLGGTDANVQLQKLQESLPSKAMLEKFDADLKGKQQAWDARLKTLPQEKDIRALNERLNKIKYKDFKTPQELQTSVQELDKVLKDGDAMYKQVQTTGDDLGKDLKAVETQYKDIEKQIKTDISSLEQHFRIPQLDAKAMTRAMFNKYLAPYKSKFYRYKEMADKYLPPNLMKKDKKGEDIAIQPHPREKGISYEFGRANSYPLFWVKRTAVSSQAGVTPDAGNIKGEILDITSNQRLVGKPTVATLAGDFPSKEIFGFLLRLSLDNTKALSVIAYKFNVDAYSILGKDLVKTPDVSIAFNKATGAMGIEGKVVGLKNIVLAMNNKFTKVDYAISAKNEVADQILKAVFAGIPAVTLTVNGQGDFPDIPLNINSNLGPELQQGFSKQIQAKVDEARARIQAVVDQEIGKQRAQVEAQLNQLRGQFDGEVKKAQAQIETQRKQAESRIDQAKKDAENQGRKQLEKEGQKALDSLKEKFGF